jgi:hypothetical protein
MASWKSPQLFSSVTTGGEVAVDQATYQQLTATLPLGYPQRFSGGDTGCERLWRVRSTGREVLRYSAAGVNPLPRDQIEVTHYKKVIKLQSRALTTRLTLDIGQTIELYGFSLDVDILGPPGMAEVSTSVAESLTVERTGLVSDAVLAVEILAIEAPLGNREARFTQHLYVENNTQPVIAIPFGAIGLRVLQTAGGGAATTWNRFIGDPSIHSSLAVGQITFTNRISDVRSSEIGDATHIQVDLDAINDRFFTLIWRIRP